MNPPLQPDLKALERAEIDAAFAAAADDRAFQAESVALAEEAVQSGWEALLAAEADEAGV